MREIEQVVAEMFPHEETLVMVKGSQRTFDLSDCPGSGQCRCGADRKRARMLAAIQMHVDEKTRGRVYLDRPRR